MWLSYTVAWGKHKFERSLLHSGAVYDFPVLVICQVWVILYKVSSGSSKQQKTCLKLCNEIKYLF